MGQGKHMDFLPLQDDEIAIFSTREEVLLPKADQAGGIVSVPSQEEHPEHKHHLKGSVKENHPNLR